ncbi:MAG: regulatory iron-sulfur-containing complex subunit RicT [Pirellulaceae bacterium]|nr:regulatory iron-sulfur-containing complex subunit RicT [Pirellulaceae bacterium]
MPKYVVRHGSTRALAVLNTRGGDRFSRGVRVVARTNRGLEVGEVLCAANEDSIARLKDGSHGQILRAMTAEDENELAHLRSRETAEFQKCQQYVEKLELTMELVDIEHIFGGERIVVYYLAEQRVDFRELVKQLASEFQTRIEMRQIGVRDEAKLLADYGDCGKPVCCNTHLSEMPPVSMKMAKLQKATLDPTKISGRCGRLKCCLRYEFDTYEELLKELPPVGSDVVTENGRARVLNQEVLSQQLLIQAEDNRRMMIDASEVLSVLRTGKKGGRDSGDRSEKPRDSADSSKPEGRRGRQSNRRSQGGRAGRGGKNKVDPDSDKRDDKRDDKKKPGDDPPADASPPETPPQSPE